MRFAVLGSGSNGNSYAFDDGKNAILIDEGFSFIELQRRLDSVSIPFSRVRCLCMTHLHPDHSKGMGTFVRRTALPVYLNGKTFLKEQVVLSRFGLEASAYTLVEEHHSFQVGDFTLECFPTSHDSGGSVGWAITSSGERSLLVTDTGVIPSDAATYARQADLLFLEANYDNDMLAKGPYPLSLKRRIAGKWGHLSNEQAISFLKESGFHGKKVYFVHLSATNNLPSLLEREVRESWDGSFIVCERGKCYQGDIE